MPTQRGAANGRIVGVYRYGSPVKTAELGEEDARYRIFTLFLLLRFASYKAKSARWMKSLGSSEGR